ncbi:hypothetical protein K8Q98_03275 [Candidatus Nomurabacteria bacterium]|nr:hypothetical protein [Candidatus Nomurabacteria bacterium]
MKHKRIILIASAIVFLLFVFFLKNANTNYKKQKGVGEELVYSNEIIGNLVGKDTDRDGVLDWEESLWGTDPNKSDTDGDGVTDDIEIVNLKQKEETEIEVTNKTEPLTQTDQFSRELFSTVAALNESGQLNQTTTDALTNSLIKELENQTPRKTYYISEIKTTTDGSLDALNTYTNAMKTLYNTKYPGNEGVMNVLIESLANNEDIDVAVLAKLKPIIAQIDALMADMLKITVPEKLSTLHLNILNALERWKEGLNDIQLVGDDALMAVRAISQYETNVTLVEDALKKLLSRIQIEFNNLNS